MRHSGLVLQALEYGVITLINLTFLCMNKARRLESSRERFLVVDESMSPVSDKVIDHMHFRIRRGTSAQELLIGPRNIGFADGALVLTVQDDQECEIWSYYTNLTTRPQDSISFPEHHYALRISDMLDNVLGENVIKSIALQGKCLGEIEIGDFVRGMQVSIQPPRQGIRSATQMEFLELSGRDVFANQS